MKKYSLYIIVFLSPLINLSAQLIPVDETTPAKQYPYANPAFNRAFNSSGLDSFYQKLFTLKKPGADVVTIVHIGDSHTQADLITAVVRTHLHQQFGNASTA